jgi:hypothetical protein
MSTATASTASIRETLLREVSVIPAGYCPKVLHFIETLKEENEDDYENWSDERRAEWLANNPPIPIEDDPTITPEHLERLRQRSRDVDEGRTKVIPFTDEEWEEFCREMEHSPEEAIAKAESRRCYLHELTPKQS